MGWPLAFSCFALLQLPGLSQLLSSFSDPSCQAGSCASALCLPAHREPDFSLRCMVYPPPSLSSHRRADFAYTSIKWLDFNGNNCFLPWVHSIHGSRCARTEEGTFPDVPRHALRIWDQASAWHPEAEPPTHPNQWSCSVLWLFSFGGISPMLCNFCLYRGLPTSLKLSSSVACRPTKDSVSNQWTPFYTGPPGKLSLEVFTPSPTVGKNDWKMVDIL